MSLLMVPNDKRPWPSLGGALCDWIETHLCFGPGDLLGKPAIIDDEKRALIWRMYEVYPKGHARAGRRRFKRVGISLAKGTAKTELAAWIAAGELHPAAPVRCIGWTKKGEPIGGPVTDPYIPMVATSEEQSDELAYGALKAILEHSSVARDFDIGLERIAQKIGHGKAVSLASTPDARDGARTTFQVFDESHRHTSARLKNAHKAMMANLPKRKQADAWSLEITTAFEPGNGSVAEATMDYARQIDAGKITDASLFFFHRQASEDNDFSTPQKMRSGVIEASGPMAAWRDIDGIVGHGMDPTTDRSYFRRTYGNQILKGSAQAFDVLKWKKLHRTNFDVKPGAVITIGFDGSLSNDSTAIVATEVESGYQWVAGLWEKPVIDTPDAPWRVPGADVDAAMCALFDTYTVWRLYADPPHWDSWIDKWRGKWGEERVISWWTNREKPMAYALLSFVTAIAGAEISYGGHLAGAYTQHIGNARKQDVRVRDEHGQPLWWIRKERPESPMKIDIAMAGVLSWEARNDAIAAGVDTADTESAYETEGLLIL